MANLAHLLEGAATYLQAQMSYATGGTVPPAHMCQKEAGIIEVLKRAQVEAPANLFALTALSRMEMLNQSPGNVMRNAVQAGPGASVGKRDHYVAELQVVLNLVKQAQQVGSGGAVAAAMSAGRTNWTLQNWQANDSEGLARMIAQRDPVFMQLYKKEHGTDFMAASEHNKRN